ncbi:hypothetical protein [Curtobacterium luteum]|uniref:hypothetical protein n=1 Tax=Curtobacterium luteum TaxID=33881 RepID=UPI0037FE5DCD
MRSAVALRLVDQGAWSAAFFLLTITASHVLDVDDFASLTVVTSVGVVAAACARAFAMDGRIVAAARHGLGVEQALSSRVVLASSALFALLAVVASALWLLLGPVQTGLPTTFLAALIVLADGPHFLLTMRRRFRTAIIGAAPYALVAAVAATSALVGAQVDVLAVWAIGLVLSSIASWAAVSRLPRRAVSVPAASGTSSRIAAEALYSALGSQLGILIVYLVASPAATAGIRLTYSVVYAPAFSIIQALTPLLLVRMSELDANGGRARGRLAARWVLGGLVGVAASGVAGWGAAATGLAGSASTLVLPFLVPIGAALLGNLVLDAALLVLRFRTHARTPHRVRLAVVTGDLAVQLVLTLWFGLVGLVTALVAMAVVKVVVAALARRSGPVTALPEGAVRT